MAIALLASLPAMASGTLGASAGAGDPYALGKRVYLQRLACTSCPVAGGVASADAARDLVQRIERDEFTLRPRDQRAAVAYLKRRWRLQ